jgi:CHAT domain-containing protein/tetratricopeptide (TPR) repeat protein
MRDQSSRTSTRYRTMVLLATPISLLLIAGSVTGSLAATNRNSSLAHQQSEQIQEAGRLLDESWRLRNEGQLPEAINAAERSLEIIRTQVGPNDPRLAITLRDLGSHYLKAVNTVKAEGALTEALNIFDKWPDVPPGHITNLLLELGQLYVRTIKLTQARTHLQRLLDIYKSEGSDDVDLALALMLYADTFLFTADSAAAKPHYLRALELARDSTEPNADVFIAALNSRLGLLAFIQGDRAEALRLLKDSVPILDSKFPAGRDYVGLITLYLAALYEERGESVIAEPVYERALEIMETSLSADNLYITAPLFALASFRQDRGDYPTVERLLFRAFSILEKAPVEPGVDTTSNVVFIMTGLGNYYLSRGEIDKAEAMAQRGLAILEKRLGEDHVTVGHALVLQSTMYAFKRNDEGYYRNAPRIIAIFKKALTPAPGPTVFQTQTNENNAILFAGMRYLQGNDSNNADAIIKRVISMAEKSTGTVEQLGILGLLKAFGLAYRAKGDYTQAEMLFQRALDLSLRAYGPTHPEVADIKNHLATLYNAKGEIDKAVAAQAEAIDIRGRDISQIIATGSERQKLLYFNTTLQEMYGTISLHLQSAFDQSKARDLAFETILNRKALPLDAMVDTVSLLRRRLGEQERELLGQWLQYRSELSTLVRDNSNSSSADQRRQRIGQLESLIEKLESDLSNRSSEFRNTELRSRSHRAKLKDIQATIPGGSVLVEFIMYYPFDARAGRFGAPRYAAYILGSQGESRSVELGPAVAIDAAVNAFSDALRGESSEVKRLGRELDELCMRKVRSALGVATHVLLSPDGALNTIPFEALVDEKGNYLIDSYAFTYLTTGRDLLRFNEPVNSKEGAVAVIDPAYDAPASGRVTAPQAAANSPGEGAGQRRFPILSGGEQLADKLKELFPPTRVLSSNEATEKALGELKGPFLLHISTHGFYDDDTIRRSSGPIPTTQTEAGPNPAFAERLMIEDNPLFRSGLALAGANRQTSSMGDGILTAYEMASLDLWGTKLVVLSACETARGDVRNGNGVFGLRRSLVIAGSESQVISLWQVDKLTTGALIETYYGALRSNMGRGAALQYAQKRIRERRAHPYFWAAFIQSGRWSGLSEN